MSALPVAPTIHVIEHRTYVRTAKRWIALCVVQTEFGVGLKFYKWIWRDSDLRWKVDLARFSVVDVDLCRVASDAVELAQQYGLRLDWPTLEQVSKVGVSVQSTPACPNCGRPDRVEEVETTTTWHCRGCDESWNASQP